MSREQLFYEIRDNLTIQYGWHMFTEYICDLSDTSGYSRLCWQENDLSIFTNLLLVRAVSDTSLSVMTSTPYRPQRLRAVLTWHGGDLAEDLNLFPDKLADFRGYKMRVVTFHFPPRIFMKEKEKGSKPILYGVDIEVCINIIIDITI